MVVFIIKSKNKQNDNQYVVDESKDKQMVNINTTTNMTKLSSISSVSVDGILTGKPVNIKYAQNQTRVEDGPGFVVQGEENDKEIDEIRQVPPIANNYAETPMGNQVEIVNNEVLEMTELITNVDEIEIAEDETKGTTIDENIESVPVENEKIEHWLTELNLNENYVESFVLNGYTSMELIKRIDDENKLREMGIYDEDDLNALMIGIQGLMNDFGDIITMSDDKRDDIQ